MLENNKISKKNNKNEPAEKENSILKIIASEFLSTSSHSLNPIANLTEDNINKMIETENKHDERKFKDKREKRIFIIVLSIFFGLLILSILFIFKDNMELLKIIIPSILSLSIGAFGGYGYGKTRGKDIDD